MYPKDLDAGGSMSDLVLGIIIGVIISGPAWGYLTYWAIDSGFFW